VDEKRRSVFLERSSYRRRRARDASRLLPVLSLFLFSIPGFWQAGSGGEIKLSSALIFLFAVWCVAIAIATLLSRFLSEPVIGESGDPDSVAGG